MADIKVDFNRVNRQQYLALMQAIENAQTIDEKIQSSAKLAEAVIVSWPYKQEITVEGYNALGMIDVSDVDDALTSGISELNSKNLARRSIYQASFARHLASNTQSDTAEPKS